MKEKKKWYEHRWAVRLLLILFYPVGVYGFIRSSKKPVITMIITTLVYGGFWALVIVSPSPPPETVQEMSLEGTISSEAPETTNTSMSDEPLTLYHAAEKGDLKMVNKLLKKGEAPYITPLQFSGIIENDEAEKDSYYIALVNRNFEIVEAISKRIIRTPYWVGRRGIIGENLTHEIIECLSKHYIILPIDDVVMLINVLSTVNNNDIDRQNALRILNRLAKFDKAHNTYSEFGIDLSRYINSEDLWSRMKIEDVTRFNQIAGKWEGSTRIYNPEYKDYNGTPLEDAYIFVNLKAKFHKNIREASDKYFNYKLEVFYDEYLDSFVNSLAKESSMPKLLFARKKKELWRQIMTGVEAEYKNNDISGETKLRNYSVISDIALSAQIFKKYFLETVYINATKDKMKITFSGSYISNILPVSYFDIELEKK
jgi:hypothetical protein